MMPPLAGRVQPRPPRHPEIRAILQAARERYARLPPLRRPALRNPADAVKLLTAEDLLDLARRCYYPIPAGVLAWLTTTPRVQPAPERRPLRLDDLLDLAEREPGRLRDLLWTILRRKG